MAQYSNSPIEYNIDMTNASINFGGEQAIAEILGKIIHGITTGLNALQHGTSRQHREHYTPLNTIRIGSKLYKVTLTEIPNDNQNPYPPRPEIQHAASMVPVATRRNMQSQEEDRTPRVGAGHGPSCGCNQDMYGIPPNEPPRGPTYWPPSHYEPQTNHCMDHCTCVQY